MFKNLVASLLLLVTISACAKQDGQSQYNYKDVGQSTMVDFGTILLVREVGITGKNTGTGAVIGAGAGAGAGSYAGNGSGTLWVIAGGALAGAAIGAVSEQALADKTGVEYTVIKENGKTLTIAQNVNKGDRILKKGERVIVQTSGSYQRVLPAEELPETIKRPKGIKFSD